MFDFRFHQIWRESEYIERLLSGMLLSIELTVVAGVLGFGLALILATGRRSMSQPWSLVCAAYIEFIRNTPLIVQLFFVAFGLPMLLEYRWPFVGSALLALVINFSAYFAEIIRAGLDSLSRGQIEAGLALNLNGRQRFFLVVLPQALANVYPSLVSQFVFLFLTTGIISEIGVEELTWSGRFVADRTFRDFEVYVVLTVLYVLIALIFRLLLTRLQPRLFPWWKSR